MSRSSLHITNAYHPASGGIRTFYRALLAAANAQHRRLRLLVPGVADDVEDVGDFGRIYYVRANPAPAFDRRYRLMMPGAYLGVSPRIVRILRDERPDVVEICDKYTLFYLAALLRKGLIRGVARPTLVGLSCERMDDNVDAFLHGGRAVRGFSRWYMRHIYGPPFDYHIANSDYTADELRRALWDRAPDFIHVLGMGVNVEAFSADHRDETWRRTLLTRAGGTAASALLFYAGRVSPEKNAALLIETMARLSADVAGRDCRLVVAGDGPMVERLKAEADARTPGCILWLGALDDRQLLARCYASADVFVHPNPREPFGIGPLEAMASGVPVVLPAAGGVLTYANDTNAWLAEPTADAFAGAIRAALGERSPQRVRAAMDTALKYRWAPVAERFFALYDRLDLRRRLGVAACGLRPVTGGAPPPAPHTGPW